MHECACYDFRNTIGDFERGQRLGVHIVFANQYHARTFHEATISFIHRAPLRKRAVVEHTRKVLAVIERAVANVRHALWDGHALKATVIIKRFICNFFHAIGDYHIALFPIVVVDCLAVYLPFFGIINDFLRCFFVLFFHNFSLRFSSAED